MSRKEFSKVASFFALLISGAAFWLGSAPSAFAQTLRDVMCLAFQNAKPFGNVFQWIAYISGAMAALKGIHHLRLHADSPQNNKLVVPLCYLGGAMCLLALPDLIGTLEKSLGATGNAGLFGCGAVGAVSKAKGLEQVITNFVQNFKEPLTNLASLTAVLSGLFMIVHGLMKASKYGTDPKTHSLHGILTNLGFGTLLMTIGNNMHMMLASLFGTPTADSSSVLTYAGLIAIGFTPSAQFKLAVASSLTFVQIIGAIAFVRGWLILKKVVEGGGNASLTQGLTHIIGGIFCINIFGFLVLMDATFGINLLT